MAVINAIFVRTSSSFPLKKGTISALAPLSVSPPRTLIAASGTSRILKCTVSCCPHSPKCLEGKLSEDCIRHPALIVPLDRGYRELVRNRGLRSATGLRAKLLGEACFFGVGEETVSG